MSQVFEGTPDEYDQVNQKLDPQTNPPEGLIVHTVADVGGKMRSVDVWESEALWEKFAQERIGLAVAEVTPDAGEPQIEVQELHNVFLP